MAKLVARLYCLINMLFLQNSGFESRHISKIQNGWHEQRSGHNNLARQKNMQKYICTFLVCRKNLSLHMTLRTTHSKFSWYMRKVSSPVFVIGVEIQAYVLSSKSHFLSHYYFSKVSFNTCCLRLLGDFLPNGNLWLLFSGHLTFAIS